MFVVRRREGETIGKATGILVREAGPGDLAAAELLFDSAPREFTFLAGSPQRARDALTRLWVREGHSMSYQHAWVAEIDGHPEGVAVGFPSASRYRLHLALLRQGARDLKLARMLLVPPALAWLVAAAPRPPRHAFYGAVIAVSPPFVRRGVATALLDSMREFAADAGYSKLVGHTGVRHALMRSTLERYGFRAGRERNWGYVLYELDLRDGASAQADPPSPE